jgi:Domain of unknown function (DUF6456)
MPRANRAARALIIAEAMTTLARLAGEDAYIAVTNSSEEVCAVYASDNGLSQPAGHVSRPAVAYSLRKGWLEWDKLGQCLRISAAGQHALRTKERDGNKRRGSRVRPKPRPLGHEPLEPQRPPAEGPLAMLRRRKHKDGRPLVTDAQFTAGEMLAADFWHGQLSPRVTANWSVLVPAHRLRRSTPGVGVEMRDAVAAARQRFHRALDAVGPELAGVLVDVCCHDVGLEAAGRAWGWPQRAAKVVLELALTRLARHYGLIAPERPAASRMRHWGDTDYRPSIDAWR